MTAPAIVLRPSKAADAEALRELYLATAAGKSGLARDPDEIDLAYIEGFLAKSEVAISAWAGDLAVGDIHAGRLGIRQFAHNLLDLTVAVHPGFQGQGLGRRLFEGLFEAAAALTPKIERIELYVRAGHVDALRLYERLGFTIEARYARRVRLSDGTVEDDLSMVKWLT
jgi:ribosomal protein S18 acetylase RimI-like enzyme